MYVYVLDKDNNPLMPTTRFGNVRRLLKENKAKVISRTPFVIKLLYDTVIHETQKINLGIDTGSKYIGAAAIGNDKIYYQSETELRTDIKTKMDRRREYRRTRRCRKTRYRKPRFLNRKNSTKLKRLPPSVRHKVQAHIDEIEFIKKILPISKLILEVSQFDPHLMKNPKLLSNKIKKWGYQKGFNYSFASRREAILNRDKYQCQYCKVKNTRFEIHHIIPRNKNGTDDENNLITLCHDCHNKVHKGLITINKKPKKLNLKYATHMNIIRKYLLEKYPDAIETFGFVTKLNRDNLNLPKDHFIDACVIASGGKTFKPNDILFRKKRVSKGDYQRTKGIRSEVSIPNGKISGFKKFDKVMYSNNIYFIKGRMNSGYCILMNIYGDTIKFENPKTVKLVRCNRITSRNTILTDSIHLTTYAIA